MSSNDMISNDMSSNDMISNDMSSNDMSVAKAATVTELAPALAAIGKVILRAQDMRELSWQPDTKSYGLNQHGAAVAATALLIKVEDSDQERQLLSEVAELVFMLNFLAWNDAQWLAEKWTAKDGSNSEGSNSEGSNSEGSVPLGAESQ